MSTPRPASANRYALVVGNQSYQSAAKLASARNDAVAIAAKLTELKFETHLVLDATHESLTNAVRSFRKSLAHDGSLALFYYAGHGVQIDGINYLVPVDAKITSRAQVASAGVSVDLVLAAMNDAHKGANLVFLDACRDDPFPATERGGNNTFTRGLAMINAPNGTMFAYATAPGQTAREESPHGIYTGALLQHLSAPGLTVEQVHKLAAADVQAATNSEQVPWIAYSLTADVRLNPSFQDEPPSAQQLLALGMRDHRQGDYLGAIGNLTEALKSTTVPLSALQRGDTEKLRAHARASLAVLKLQLEPRLAMVWVDGSVRFSEEGRLLLNPGARTVEVSQDGYQTLRRDVTLAAGEQQIFAAKLVAGSVSPPSEPTVATAPSAGDPSAEIGRALIEQTNGEVKALVGATNEFDRVMQEAFDEVARQRKEQGGK